MEMNDYRPKFIAFIDILGFKDMVKNIENHIFSRVFSALNYLNEDMSESNTQHDLLIYEQTEDGLIERELGNPIMTYVSDCVIISVDLTFDGFYSLCNKVTKFTNDLMADGLFVRGAITKGYVYHNGKILFGEGYIRAYQLEEKSAIYPRVIIDDDVIDFLKDYNGQFPLNEGGVKKAENYTYLRIFPWYYFSYYTMGWNNYLMRVRGHILYNLNKYDARVDVTSKELKKLSSDYYWKEVYGDNLVFAEDNAKVLNKYIFLKNEFNDDIYNHKKVIPDICTGITFRNNIWYYG